MRHAIPMWKIYGVNVSRVNLESDVAQRPSSEGEFVRAHSGHEGPLEVELLPRWRFSGGLPPDYRG